MKRMPSQLALVLILAIILSGCEKKEEQVKQQDAPPVATSTVAVSVARPALTPDTGFDIDRAPVANPQLGKFPYVGLIEGYQRGGGSGAKDVAFDRYEFFDGVKIIPVEGRLTTIEATGKGASAYQVFKTYEALVTGLGGVKVHEGKAERMKELNLAFNDQRHRKIFIGDRMGSYVLRTPEKEIWFEAYVGEYLGENYYLTIIEKQALQVKAALLPAAEMKRELDAKGHVALYINFDFDKADINPESQPIIDEIVKLLKNNPGLSLTVEGHTDNVGAPDYNRRLSDARARSVAAALTARAIVASRLKAAGFGQDKPIADNGTDDGRAKNRRVELVKM